MISPIGLSYGETPHSKVRKSNKAFFNYYILIQTFNFMGSVFDYMVDLKGQGKNYYTNNYLTKNLSM